MLFSACLLHFIYAFVLVYLIMVLDLFCFLSSAGVDDNDTIRAYGSGGADPDGNQPGDLYVTIKVPSISCTAVITVSMSLIYYSYGAYEFFQIFSYKIICSNFLSRSEKTLFFEEKGQIFMLMLC